MKQYKIKLTSIKDGENKISASLVDDSFNVTSNSPLKIKPCVIDSILMLNSFFSLWVDDDDCDINSMEEVTGIITPLSLTDKASLLPFSSSDLPRALAQSKKYSLSDEAMNSLYQEVTHLHNRPELLLKSVYDSLKKLRFSAKAVHSYASLILQTGFFHFLMPFWTSTESNRKLISMTSMLSNRSIVACWNNPMLLATRFRVISGSEAYLIVSKIDHIDASNYYKEHINSLAMDLLVSVETKLGSIFYPINDVANIISKYFYTADEIKLTLLSDENSDIFFIYSLNDIPYISRKTEYDKEEYILSKLTNISKNVNSKINLICKNTRLLDKFLLSEGVTLKEEQRNSFELLLSSPVSLLTGDPGTGKTFTSTLFIRYIEQCLNISSDEILLLSPTGIVSQRLSESSGMQAKTFHRAMKMFSNGETAGEIVVMGHELFKEKVILVDESSMPNLDVFFFFCKCLPDDSKVILVGDPDQLPSIGSGKVFSDLVKYRALPHAHLTKSQRTKPDNSIHKNAREIIYSPNNATFVADEDSIQIVSENNADILIAAKKAINIAIESAPESIFILTPWHKGDLGTIAINKHVQSLLLDAGTIDHKIKYKNNRQTFFVGDRVLITKTDYKRDIYNGDIGTITDITSDLRQKDIIHASVRNKTISFTKGQAEYLDLSYCITPHKIQGSEADNIIVLIPSDSHFMLSREWLLTAMTRARKKCTVISTPLALNKICKKSAKEKRITLMDLRGKNATV